MAEISATPAPAARRYDVIAIGNAIVDVMAPAADDAIAALGLAKGGMTLVDADRAAALYAAMGPAREISGGSAANTLAAWPRSAHPARSSARWRMTSSAASLPTISAPVALPSIPPPAPAIRPRRSA
jgi:hypothetical protein